MARSPVILNVYNMYWLNEYTSSIGLGVYHSGIELFGKEYAFGGHPFEFSGIFDMNPKDVEDLGEGFSFKESIPIGFTDFTKPDIIKLVDILGDKYIGSSYHLVRNNCNHFSEEFSQLLCGASIPKWINRLASIGIRFPFIVSCMPKEWLTPDGAAGENNSPGEVDLTEWENISLPGSSTSTENSSPAKSSRFNLKMNGYSNSLNSFLKGSQEYLKKESSSLLDDRPCSSTMNASTGQLPTSSSALQSSSLVHRLSSSYNSPRTQLPRELSQCQSTSQSSLAPSTTSSEHPLTRHFSFHTISGEVDAIDVKCETKL